MTLALSTCVWSQEAISSNKAGAPDAYTSTDKTRSDAEVPPISDKAHDDHFVIGTSSPAAIVGYPIINVPMGFVFGVPVGISFMGTAFSEGKLITLASGFEHVTQARKPPQFLPTLPFNTAGLSPVRGRRSVRSSMPRNL